MSSLARARGRYTHILFDHDGVLVDTEPLYFNATQSKLKELGVELGLDEYLLLQADGANAWSRATDLGHAEQDVVAKRAERNVLYQQLLQSSDIDIPGVEAVLRQLQRHFAMAIVTTAKPEDFALIHARRGIVPCMDFVLTNRDYPRSKPAPDPYLAALERFGIAAGEALVVEDSERGLRAAVAAGIDCAAIHHPFTASQDFSAATYRIRQLEDLLDLLPE